ncbi:MAG: heme-binding protein [bacterium]
MAIEIPKYTVIKKYGQIELRKYEPYISASVELDAKNYSSAGSDSFGMLADYIFGNNTSQSKIAMTAPVNSKRNISSEKIAMTVPVASTKIANSSYVTSFTMPSKYSLKTLPKPNNDSVIIKEIPSHEVLAIIFSGYTSEAKIKRINDKLEKWAKANKINLAGEPTISRYNPPWTPGFLRRNEISYIVSLR